MGIKKLQDHQKECIDIFCSLKNKDKGIIISPTGSGKTVIGEEIIKNIIKDKKILYQ